VAETAILSIVPISSISENSTVVFVIRGEPSVRSFTKVVASNNSLPFESSNSTISTVSNSFQYIFENKFSVTLILSISSLVHCVSTTVITGLSYPEVSLRSLRYPSAFSAQIALVQTGMELSNLRDVTNLPSPALLILEKI